MHNNSNIKNLLYEFSILLSKETDLRHLYFSALPILLLAFDFEKIVLFKYSKRKLCFDPKIGLEKESVSYIKEMWEKSQNIGSFANYLLNFDITELYETDFNKKIRMMNIPCNEITRSILNPFIIKEIKNIKINELKNRHVTHILKQMRIEEALYIPLCAKNSTVGFILASPIIENKQELLSFSAMLGLCMDSLISLKTITNLEKFIESNKEEFIHKQKLYEIGKTASTITHETKNSLVGIIGLFQKLKSFVEKTEKSTKYINIIESELSKLYRFTLDINKYSRNSSATYKEFVNLNELVDKAIEMATTINSDFVFSVCIDKKASTIYADKGQLEQVLINIFKNSIEAYNKKAGGTIKVIARKEDGFIVIKIRDNSGGVKEDKLKEIVKPFYTTKTYGTGLGLSIVGEIIKEHNGIMEFSNINNGLECTIKLPIPKNKIPEDKNE